MHSPKCLVISFGGLAGFTMLGALTKLARQDKLAKITHYYGTSVGAIIGTLLAIGMTPTQIFAEAFKYNKRWTPRFIDLIRNTQTTSLCSISPLEVSLCDIFAKYNNGHVPTFAQLALRGKFLHIFAYCIDTNEPIEFCAETTPNLSVLDAALASSSIPLIFPLRVISAHEYIDGAFFTPFPLSKALLKFAPHEIIGIRASVPTWTRDTTNKFSIIMSIIYLAIKHSYQQELKLITNNMKIIAVPSTERLVITQLSPTDKWNLFATGMALVE